jgi:hypothetical protein
MKIPEQLDYFLHNRLKEEMAKKDIEYEILALRETFMHFEDAILLTVKGLSISNVS